MKIGGGKPWKIKLGNKWQMILFDLNTILLHDLQYSSQENLSATSFPLDEIKHTGCMLIKNSMKGQEGIQMLLTAEHEAQQIISSAKNLKSMRLRQAKEEAERDVELYHSNLEAAHQKNISETSGSSGSNVKRLDEETAMRIQSLKESASSVSSDVVAMLIKHVTTVQVSSLK